MTKSALRYLALGFLLSALLLIGYQTVYGSDSSNKKQTTEQKDSSKDSSTTAEDKTYKEKYEELLAQVETGQVENSSSSESSKESSSSSSASSVSSSSSSSTEKEESSSKKEYTLTIASGEPSSAAIDTLAAEGIIPDANEFTQFLADNDYETLVKDGTYELNNEMSLEQIAKIITKTE